MVPKTKLSDCFPHNSMAALGRVETVVGGLPRGGVGSALEVSVRRGAVTGHPLWIAAIWVRRYAKYMVDGWQ